MHRRLVTIRANLQDLVRTRKEEYESKKRRIESQLAANSLLRNREYSFLLYPEDQVRGFLEPLANANFLKK